MEQAAVVDRSNQKSVTLSDRALQDYETVAQWKGKPLASVLGRFLEEFHETPSFASMLRRAKEELSAESDRPAEGEQ